MFRNGWISSSEYQNSEYVGLGLDLSDDFPALAFRINYDIPGRKSKIADKNFSFQQLTIRKD